MSRVRSNWVRLAAGAAALAVLPLSGCAGDEEDAKPSSTATSAGPAKAGTVAEGIFDGRTVTFVSWGGEIQDAQVAALDGFVETSGAEIVQDGPTDGAKIKAQVDAGVVNWDVVDIADNWAVANCGTLLEKIDYSVVDTSEMMPGAEPTECGVPVIATGNVLAYNEEVYADEAPSGWADFFDTEKFPGKRGIYIGNPSVALEVALLADGVAPEDLYPLDVDRAFAKLDTIKDDIVFWDGGATVQQMMESGQIDMGLVWSGRVYGAVEAGAPWAVAHEQPFLTYDYLVIPKGSENADVANALINYYIGAEQQASITEKITYPGVNKNAEPELSENAAAFQVDKAPFSDQQYLDLDYWVEHLDELTDRWTSWANG